ncbi:MAG: hypothetical protein QOE45_1066 [Frankiaceae bacterium]|jgi:hypothetical protein|nr:hypothetical protein [Frankiaceae bacterium]
MTARLAALALGAAVALAVAAPAAPAQASTCNPTFHLVCDAIAAACHVLEPFGLACNLD